MTGVKNTNAGRIEARWVPVGAREVQESERERERESERERDRDDGWMTGG